jgi:hypothetical protein
MSDEIPPTPSPLPHNILDQVPGNHICTTTTLLAYKALPRPIFNHSVRVFLLAKWLAAKEQMVVDETLLFVACICHDLGASDLYNGKQRFEVEGADAASDVMQDESYNDADRHKVWTAIALHTSSGIAERIDPFTRLVRLGVKMDFSPAVRDAQEATAYAKEIEEFMPRFEVEKVLADAVVNQATKIPDTVDNKTWPDSEKHPKASWPGILLRAHIENPGWNGVNYAF